MRKDTIPATDTSTLPRNGASRSVVLSSNTTLVWRIFLPAFATVFLMGFMALFWLGTSPDEYGNPRILWRYRIISTAVFSIWLWFLYRFIWPLKRIEADDAFVYVCDYWHTIRYPWADVVSLEDRRRMGFPYVRMHLSSNGRFGRVIRFLPGGQYKNWLEAHSGKLEAENLG
jgi:hypothetical protein